MTHYTSLNRILYPERDSECIISTLVPTRRRSRDRGSNAEGNPGRDCPLDLSAESDWITDANAVYSQRFRCGVGRPLSLSHHRAYGSVNGGSVT